MSDEIGATVGPMARLRGKRALVTAAAQGIGEAIARRLADEGAEVLAADIDQDKLARLGRDRIETAAFDGSDAAAVAAALSGRCSTSW